MKNNEFYATSYDSKSIWSMRLVTKKALLTDKYVYLSKLGPKTWHIGLIFLPFIWLVALPAILVWLLIAQFSKVHNVAIPIKEISKVEVDHPKFTLIYRIKIVEKSGIEHYFIPRKTYWQMTSQKEFADELVREIRNKTR